MDSAVVKYMQENRAAKDAQADRVDEYVYDENEDEFMLVTNDNKQLLQDNGNRVIVRTEKYPNYEYKLARYELKIDDYGYIIAALVRLCRNKLGLQV